MSDLLPRQHATGLTAQWSLDSDNQLRSVLETALAAILGKGVVSGGAVTQTAAFTVEVATSTVLFCKGVSLTLGSAQSHSGLTPSTTNYLWGTITRTARDRFTATALDVYALTLSHNTTGTPPSDEAILLAVITTDGSGITAINSGPSGKFRDEEPASLSITVGAQAGDVIQVTVQVKSLGGNNISAETPLEARLVDTNSKTAANTADPPSAGWSAGVGLLKREYTADVDGAWETNASGVLRVDIEEAGADTWYLVVSLAGRTFISPVITFT